ncbi:MAG: hypothetical protein EOO65_01030 [Methanosarcinales archaeon]|nr:MAG: hypothetical protein EOO65_01030 [Methanosarcinales archaeon]
MGISSADVVLLSDAVVGIQAQPSESHRLDVADIVGIVIAGIVIAGLLGFLGAWGFRGGIRCHKSSRARQFSRNAVHPEVAQMTYSHGHAPITDFEPLPTRAQPFSVI